MESLTQTIRQLHDMLDSLDEPDKVHDAVGLEKQIRRLLAGQLKREDLRISAEMILTDIDNNFFGFAGLNRDNKLVLIQESLDKLARLEELVETNQVVREETGALPPPPAYALEAIRKEEKKQEEEKAVLQAEIENKRAEEKEKREAEQAKRKVEQDKRKAEQDRKRKLDENQKRLERPKRDKSRPDIRAPKIPAQKTSPEKNNGDRNRLRETNLPPKVEKKNQGRPEKPESPYTTPVMQVTGIGSVLANKFSNKKVETVYDLITYFPRDYKDRRKIFKIKDIQPDTACCVVAKVESITVKHRPGKKGGIVVVVVSDDTGSTQCKFFGGKVGAVKSAFPIGETVLLSGDVATFKNTVEFHHPDCEPIQSGNKPQGFILPVYSEGEGLAQRRIRSLIRSAVDEYGHNLIETFPESLRKKHDLPNVQNSLEVIHFPKPDEDFDLLKIHASPGHRRFVFEELFLMQLGIRIRINRNQKRKGIAVKDVNNVVEKLIGKLPFTLTQAQDAAAKKILKDMENTVPMNRLLQGDVGSGKTVVALISACAVMGAGAQAALMVPTEVLAEQHARNLIPLVESLGFKGARLTGGMPRAEQDRIRKGLADKTIDFVIGTHSLIQSRVQFANLALAVVDEQHRFGVDQRRKLADKGNYPHVLTMTATPIPRTLAMTAYGDMSISVMREKPKGRKPVITKVYESAQRDQAYEALKKELEKGRQGFIVFPLVDESDGRGAVNEAERLANNEFKDFKVGLLHGRMKTAEKENWIREYEAGKVNLIIATTVIEVGIDIPGASVMIVEHAERFGLAQLHQLRGRVGRHPEIQGYCHLLAYDTENEKSDARLKVLETVSDGMVLAEKDLEIRGQGDVLGTRQHGLPNLKISDLTRDLKILELARSEAIALLEKDPELTKGKEHQDTLTVLEFWWGGKDQLG